MNILRSQSFKTMSIKQDAWYLTRPNYATGKFALAVEYRPQQTAKKAIEQAKKLHDSDVIPVVGRRILANIELFEFPKIRK